MGQVSVNLHGRLYRFDCGDGEEVRFEELAVYLKDRIDTLAQQYGNVGADRLMLAAALLITDELMDARAALAERGGGEKTTPEKASSETTSADKASFAKAGSQNAASDKPKPSTAAPAGAQANGQPRPGVAEKREQDAIRNENRRKLAAGSEA